MTELSTFELVAIVFSLSLIFFSGLCWCFCCGTCVGRSLLRHYGFMSNNNKQRENQDYIPLHTQEQWEEDIYNEEVY
ncbi:unnamed protein product [Cunninghamella blakesleeana]